MTSRKPFGTWRWHQIGIFPVSELALPPRIRLKPWYGRSHTTYYTASPVNKWIDFSNSNPSFKLVSTLCASQIWITLGRRMCAHRRSQAHRKGQKEICHHQFNSHCWSPLRISHQRTCTSAVSIQYLILLQMKTGFNPPAVTHEPPHRLFCRGFWEICSRSRRILQEDSVSAVCASS